MHPQPAQPIADQWIASLPTDLAAPPADLSGCSILEICAKAQQHLSDASTLDEVLGIRNRAEAFVTYTRKWRSAYEAQNACRLLVALAERKIGAELKAGQESGQVATRSHHPGSVRGEDTAPVTLAEIGITRQQASNFRSMAEFGDAAIRESVAKATAEGRAVSRRDIVEAARALHPKPEKPLPTPAAAREIARATGEGVLASDNNYHFHVKPEDERKQQDWYQLLEPITALSQIAFPPARGIDAMLPSQAERIRLPLAAALAWLTELQERLNAKAT